MKAPVMGLFYMNKLEIIKELVTLLHFTPSGDNCRPFVFEFNVVSNELKIIYCKKQAEHVLNPNEISSCITLGMMDYVLSISELKINKKEFYLKSLSKDQGVVACYWIDFNDSTISPLLKDLILSRKTDRNRYVDKVKAFTEDKIMMIKDIPKDIIEMMLNSEDDFWTNESIIKDVFRWVHLSKQSYYKNKLGLYWKDLGSGIKEYPFLVLIKYCRKWAIFFYRSGVKFLVKKHFLKLESFFDLGRVSYKKWLKLSQAGYVLQPISFYTFSKMGCQNDLIDRLNQLTGQDAVFYWIFRAGKSNLISDKNIKVSKPIEQILSIV